MHVDIIPILGGGTFSTLWCLCLCLVEMSFFSTQVFFFVVVVVILACLWGRLNGVVASLITLWMYLCVVCVCLDAYVESLLIIWQNYGQCQILLPSLSSNCPLLKSIK